MIKKIESVESTINLLRSYKLIRSTSIKGTNNSEIRYNQIDELKDLSNTFKFQELLFLLKRNKTEPDKCPYCGEYNKWGFNRYYKTCGSEECITRLSSDTQKSDSVKTKKENTNMKKYGSKYFMGTDDFKNKSKEYFKSLGVKNCMQLHSVQEKFKASMNKRYGVPYSAMSDEIKSKMKETCLIRYGTEEVLANKDIRNKIESTNLKKYGCVLYTESDDFKIKQKETFTKKYDGLWPTQTEDVKNKIEATNRMNHNGVWNFQERDFIDNTLAIRKLKMSEIMSKVHSTMKEKYGYEYAVQVPEIAKKRVKKYKYNDIFFDSSWELAFYICCKDHNENINVYPDPIEYVDKNNNKHLYYPDFEIDGELYEIKGDQFLDSSKNLVPLYHQESYNDHVEEKNNCIHKNVKYIITKNEIQIFLDYIDFYYGKDYLKSFRVEKGDDICQK